MITTMIIRMMTMTMIIRMTDDDDDDGDDDDVHKAGRLDSIPGDLASQPLS